MWIESRLKEGLNFERCADLGVDDGVDKMVTILNRLATWSSQIEIEADPRHQEILLAQMNLDGANGKSATTPAGEGGSTFHGRAERGSVDHAQASGSIPCGSRQARAGDLGTEVRQDTTRRHRHLHCLMLWTQERVSSGVIRSRTCRKEVNAVKVTSTAQTFRNVEE